MLKVIKSTREDIFGYERDFDSPHAPSVFNSKKIKRQIYVMHNNGIGSFFIYSRAGLETEYWGNKWFKCVKAAVNTAKELGIYA